MPCPRTQQANLPACSPQPSRNAKRQAGKLRMPFFKVFWYDATRGMNPRSTDCEADALTTTPLRRSRTFQVFLENFWVHSCFLPGRPSLLVLPFLKTLRCSSSSSDCLCKESLSRLCKAFLRPVFSHASLKWFPFLSVIKLKLLHRVASHTITGCLSSCAIPLLSEASLPPYESL